MKKSSLNPVKFRSSVSSDFRSSPLSTLANHPFPQKTITHLKLKNTCPPKPKPNFLSADFSSLCLDQSLNHGYKHASRNFSSSKNPFTMQAENMTSRKTFMDHTSSTGHNDNDDMYYTEQHSCLQNEIHSSHLQKHKNIWCVALAPVHLNGLDAIAKTFGKSRQTIKKWCKQGAPIAFDGFTYCSEYMTLFIWFLNNNPSLLDEQGT